MRAVLWERAMEGGRRYVIFALLASVIVLVGMQFSTSAVALPALIEDLDPPLRWAGWVFTTYTLGSMVSLPLAGRLVARLGARATYVAGVLGFAAMSFGCALAPNIWALILARAGQGIASGCCSRRRSASSGPSSRNSARAGSG